MSTNHETGKNINASNFIEKVNVADRRKDEYKPSNPAIQLSALTPIQKLISAALDEEKRIQPLLTKAVNNRNAVYELMEKTVTRAINVFAGTSAASAQIEAGKKLLKKFKSIRISEKPDVEEIKAQAAAKGVEAVIPSTRSNSQQGYVNRLANFNTIISFLSAQEEYVPNESDLSVAAMQKIAADANAANLERNSKSGEMSTAMETRTKLMNGEPDGAYYLSQKINSYVLGASGRNSAFYKELMKYPVRKR
jgi:hypothetical protein